MSKIDNGGPAFPVKGGMCFFVPESVASEVKVEIQESIAQELQGMTLRQWYAGQALPVIAARPLEAIGELAKQGGVSIVEAMATLAFKLADAMIAEDKKPGGDS